MAMARSRTMSNPLPKIGAIIVWLLIWGGLAGTAYAGWEIYGVYAAGYEAGVESGHRLAEEVRVLKLKAGTYTNRLGEYKRHYLSRMKTDTWTGSLYAHGWESGLHSVVDYVPH